MSRTFHSACGERPRRLNADTRQFAWESLHGKYGDEARKSHAIALDDVPGFEALSPQAQYDIAIMKIAREAPLRICAHERVSGAATLGLAIQHAVPVTYKGRNVFSSVSHLTLDFQTVVFKGVDFLDARINSRLAESGLPEMRRVQLEGMKNVIRAMRVWHARYLDALKDNRPENFRILEKVPFKPAANFREGVQSIWFTFAFTRLCGNWPGIGRIDEMLGGLLKHDLAAGAITLDEARETLASMFIKGCEWVRSNPVRDTGDAQHYQNIVLAGINRDGVEITNEVTHLVLDVVEELGISDFPITLRISRNTPDSLLTHAAEVMRHGGGVVALYNEPLILEALELAGYDRIEARDFANDGCWEVQIPGKTCFGYFPFDGLGLLLNDTLRISGWSARFVTLCDEWQRMVIERLER